MHISIDDTYGGGEGNSIYVTDTRRTHVAVLFNDDEVPHIREQIRSCLSQVSEIVGFNISEFHFADIYNRKNDWCGVDGKFTLSIFKFFSDIYRHYKWRVVVQTIDNRTFDDHPEYKDFLRQKEIIKIGKLCGFDFSKRSDVSLFMVLTKIKRIINPKENLNIYVDEGLGGPGKTIGNEIYRDWQGEFSSIFESSSKEPLLQIADFLAFCINRITVLSLKKERTVIDNWFIKNIGSMPINSDDIRFMMVNKNFTSKEFDNAHKIDRKIKGLE